MPTRRSSYGRQGGKPGRRSFRRRRASVSTRARFQRPSARNQQRQIQSLAKLALRNRRMLSASKSYTDWFQRFNNQNITGLWFSQELLRFVDWEAGNRQDADVLVSQNVFLRNMVIEWYANSFNKDQACVFEVFVVSIRSNASNWLPSSGPAGVLTEGLDYENMGSGNMVALNSGVFKVHFAKMFQLFPRDNPDGMDPDPLDFSGNPFTTYRRGKINLSLNMKVRSPAGLSWKNLNMNTLPPNQRLYLLYRAQSSDSTNQYQFSWATHTTAIAQS